MVAQEQALYRSRIRGWRELAGVLGAIALGLAVIGALFGGRSTAFDEVGLGSTAKVVFAHPGGRMLHGNDPWSEPAPPAAGRRLLWVGASQMHTIMRFRDGDRTFVDLAAERLRADGIDVIAYSLGNANPRWLWLAFEAARHQQRVDGLVLALVYDDLKEEDHPQLSDALSIGGVAHALQKSPAGKALLDELNALRDHLPAVVAGAGAKTAQGETDVQDVVERTITNWLSETWPLWRVRPEARGWIITTLMDLRYRVLELRYTLLGRPVPPAYVSFPQAKRQQNEAALFGLLHSLHAAGIPVLAYVVPRPRHVFFPYEPVGYARFKAEVARGVEAAGGTFLDLEDAVDDAHWGDIYNGRGGRQLDIFHFDGQGHRQFADTMVPVLKQFGSR